MKGVPGKLRGLKQEQGNEWKKTISFNDPLDLFMQFLKFCI